MICFQRVFSSIFFSILCLLGGLATAAWAAPEQAIQAHERLLNKHEKLLEQAEQQVQQQQQAFEKLESQTPAPVQSEQLQVQPQPASGFSTPRSELQNPPETTGVSTAQNSPTLEMYGPLNQLNTLSRDIDRQLNEAQQSRQLLASQFPQRQRPEIAALKSGQLDAAESLRFRADANDEEQRLQTHFWVISLLVLMVAGGLLGWLYFRYHQSVQEQP